MKIIDSARKVLKILNDNGFEAYIVGGYVRDTYLGISSNDIDITTNARIDDLKKYFEIIDNGSMYESITIKIDDYKFEITTYRRDLYYKDHRHPVVEITDNILDDLKRRDYKMNALLMDYNLNVIDKVDGIKDINNKVINMIGDPQIRFDEDALRILRGLYLVSKFDFDLSSDVIKAMNDKGSLLDFVSGGKKRIEFDKLIPVNKTNKVFDYIIDTNIINYLPNLKKGIEYFKSNDIIVNDLDVFYGVSFYLNKGIDKSFEFNRAYSKVLENAIKIVDYNDYRMLGYSEDVYKISNKIKKILGIKYISYSDMAIHDINEIKIDKLLIKKITASDKISKILNEIADELLLGNLINEESCIIDYLEKRNK